MPNSPTIVSAALSDKELQDSINKMVANFDKGLQTMLEHSNEYVGKIQESLQKIGNTNFGAKSSNDGVVAKRTKSQNAETDAVEKNIAARDKQIKKNQEVSMSYDQMAAATQKATSGSKMSVIETYDMQIEMFKNRLREVRQDIDIFNAAIGSGKKTQIEWGQQGLKQANAEAEKLMRIITTLENQRGNLANVIAPQGHTIQNYVNSLQKANPELAQLNDSFKRGQSLMQNGIITTQQLANAQGELNKNTNQSKQTLDDMNAYIRQNIQREQERRDAIRQTGLAARETADQLIRSAHEQASAQGSSPITGIKELTIAVEQMRRAYFDMSASERMSPVGTALEADIKRANEAITVIRKYNQSLLGSQQNDANKITNASTLNSLRESLKNLTEQYNKLTVAELNAGKGDALIQHFQDTTRAAQILQRTLNRPVNLKAALSGDERTLDDIAYKIQRLQSYKLGLDLTDPKQVAELNQIDAAINRLNGDLNKYMGTTKQATEMNKVLSRSWNYMKNRLAFYFTVGASTSFIKNLIEVRSQYEMNERALGILINSAERGTQIFNELSQMALVSPYTLIELSTAAKQLTAYDIAAKDVVDTTRRLADMASAVGIPIERLTYALGQIKAYGYLNSRDARMFANAGIPLVKQLSEYYTELEGRLVSTADVYDRIKKKSIDYNEVMEVINKMTDQGGKFFDFQAKMADTLKVRLANLTLAWNNMLNEIGKSNQGILTFGIGALKELFLQWKKFSSAIYSAAWAGGLVIAIRALNVLLVKAGFNFRILSKDMKAAEIAGQGLATKMSALGKSIAALAKSSLTWWSLLAFAIVDAAKDLYYINEAQENLNKSIRDGAKDNYDNISKFLEQYKEVRGSLYSTKKVAIGSIYNPTTKKAEATAYAEQQVGQDIDKNEAKKAWEAIREQIELTSQSSDVYISKLLTIENMSERVRQGFNILDDIQVVNAALKELDDDTIKVSKGLSAWWNAWQAPDGLITNLKDLEESEKRLLSVHSSVQEAFTTGNRIDLLQDYLRDLKRLREDLKVTTDSIINFIELKGWSGDEGKINQVFEQITQKIILDNQLDPQKAFTLQTEIEEARSKAAKNALVKRIQDEQAALKVSYNQDIAESLKKDIDEYKHWDDFNGRKKVEWERFTKWLKEQHISETTQMFRNMDAEDIKSLNFQEGKHAEWVNRMVTKYAKEHKMSYDEAFNYLKSRVRNANTWSIFIPLIISTEDKKSVYDQLGEYDKAIDDADSQIERLTRRIGELRAKRKLDKEELRELVHAQQELTDAEEAKAEAEAKGGHGKKEKKDEKAARKAAGQAESELQKALKDELSTIDKVRSIYKDLTKEGMSHADAVERATRGWGETVNAINKVLQKNGLQKLDLSKFAGIENPRELVNMLQSQLDILVKRGAKAAEIKELQAKIQTLNVDADKYDLTRITKGLNNELGKLKDEYELAVELDANPEMGNMFTEMFGLDTSDFPKTIDEYMQRVQQEFDKMRKKRNFSAPLNIFKAGDKEWEEWGRQVGLVVDVLDENGNVIDKNTDALDKLTPKFKEAQGVAKKWAQDTIKATQDLEYKLGDLAKKVEIEEAKLAVLEDDAAKETNAAQKHLLELQIQQQKEAIEKLKMESVKLLPFYEDLFGDMYNVSVGRLKEIAKAAKEVMSPRQGDSGVGYTQRTDDKGKVVYDIFAKDKQGNIKKTTVSLEEYIKINKQIDSVQQKIAESSPWEKIKDSFSKKEGGGLKNFASGMEAIGGELQKVANITKEIGGFAEALGADENTVEIINDIAASIGGVATAAQGIGQIASGDYIGGAASVLSGAFSAISSWLDNSDKKIVAQIKDSEREVKKLENSYIDLEHAVNEAYGMATIGANMAAKANKELQLVELKRQLALEQSRDSKNRDEDKIIDLQKQIKELEYDIADTVDSIVNDLLGISSVGDAMENMMDAFIEALRSGEDAMATFDESVDEMIANMVKKMFTTKILQPWFEEQWGKIQDQINERAGKLPNELAKVQSKVSEAKMADLNDNDSLVGALRALGMDDEQIHLLNWYNEFGQNDLGLGSNARLKAAYEKMLKEAEQKEAELQKELTTATMPTTEDIRRYAELLRSGQPIMEENMQEVANFLRELGLMKDDTDKSLSALQQGLMGVSEDTAGAVEAYLNGMSQQAYLRNDLLVQIRDTIMSFDMDVQLGVFSQMLLQLQNNYIVIQSMQSMMENWTVPSGSGIRVELMS